jgi:hypothetical protein
MKGEQKRSYIYVGTLAGSLGEVYEVLAVIQHGEE